MKAQSRSRALAVAHHPIYQTMCDVSREKARPIAAIVTRDSCPACVRFKHRREQVLAERVPNAIAWDIDATVDAHMRFARDAGVTVVPSILRIVPGGVEHIATQ